MFDSWRCPPAAQTLARLDRPVIVDTARAWPDLQYPFQLPPLGIRAFGLKLHPTMPGRQVAWMRRADGGWLAVVEVPAQSANGQLHLTMTLWVCPDAITVV